MARKKTSGKVSLVGTASSWLHYAHDHVLYLNNSKFFAGVIMILLNVGSKFIAVQFSKSTEEYLKFSLSKQLLVFAMAWMGTRDIYTALVLTAVFVVLSEHLFNEESPYCMVPAGKRILNKPQEVDVDELLETEVAINSAIATLEKQRQRNSLAMSANNAIRPPNSTSPSKIEKNK